MRNVIIAVVLCLFLFHVCMADESESDLKLLSKFLVSNATWYQRADDVRQHFLKASLLSPTPQRCLLNPVRHSRRIYYDYSVENVYFESLPKFYVTGNLYLPVNATGPVPAILHPHGHFPDEGNPLLTKRNLNEHITCYYSYLNI